MTGLPTEASPAEREAAVVVDGRILVLDALLYSAFPMQSRPCCQFQAVPVTAQIEHSRLGVALLVRVVPYLVSLGSLAVAGATGPMSLFHVDK